MKKLEFKQFNTPNSKPIKAVYGPYQRKDMRYHVCVYYTDHSKRTVSYPKWLMEQKLGRELDPYTETVDHIDRNFNNNDESNLRIVSLIQNITDDVKRSKLVEIKCILCGKITYKKPNKLRHNSKQGKAGPFCSKSCVGKYGKKIQMKEIENLPVQPSPESEYYQRDKHIQ